MSVTKPKRVLFLINSLTSGGAERVMCTLLRHSLAETKEFEVTLALLDDEPAAYKPPEWTNVIQLDCRKSLARSVSEVNKLFAHIQPDVSVSFLTRANLANVLNANGRPCVISERANATAHLGSGLRGVVSKAFVRMLYPRATRVIAVSEGVAEDLHQNFGLKDDRIVTIPNPIDVDVISEEAGSPAEITIEDPYILGAGRLVESKNFKMLIRAFAASKVPGKLVIAGEGDQRDALMQVARECGVADRVLLPGYIKNPYALMQGAQVFVLPSNSEGFPNALVEAMALGVPVISTNMPSGPSEILAEAPRESIFDLTFAQYGVLVPQNAQEQLAEAFVFMQEPERRREYGQRAAERARAYSPAAAKDRYWDVIRAAMGMGAPATA